MSSHCSLKLFSFDITNQSSSQKYIFADIFTNLEYFVAHSEDPQQKLWISVMTLYHKLTAQARQLLFNCKKYNNILLRGNSANLVGISSK